MLTGDVEDLPDGTTSNYQMDANTNRIRPTPYEQDPSAEAYPSSRRTTHDGQTPTAEQQPNAVHHLPPTGPSAVKALQQSPLGRLGSGAQALPQLTPEQRAAVGEAAQKPLLVSA